LNAEPASSRPTSWLWLLAIFGLTALVEAFGVSHVFRFLPLYLRQVGTPAGELPFWTGILNSSVFLFGLPLVPFWGVWADRYGRLTIIARSAFVEMVVFGILGLAQNRYQAAAGLLLVGFQLGNTGVMLAALRAVTPPGRVGLAMSLYGIAPPLGFALGPLAAGYLVDGLHFDLHGVFLIDAALSLGAGVMLLALVHEAPLPVPQPGRAIGLALRALRDIATTPETLSIYLVFGLGYLAVGLSNPFLPLVVARLHPGPGLASQIGIVFGLTALAGAFLSPVGGLLGDRFGHARLLVAACLLSAVSLVAMTQAPSLTWLAVCAVALGLGGATVTSMVFALLAIRVPETRRSAALNLVLVPLYLTSILGGLTGAALASRSLDLVLLVAAAGALAGAVAAGTLARRPAPA
jgi:DHA1 family multidrug resistance protein-like MFS transporter